MRSKSDSFSQASRNAACMRSMPLSPKRFSTVFHNETWSLMGGNPEPGGGVVTNGCIHGSSTSQPPRLIPRSVTGCPLALTICVPAACSGERLAAWPMRLIARISRAGASSLKARVIIFL
jgi:hypothetical protein